MKIKDVNKESQAAIDNAEIQFKLANVWQIQGKVDAAIVGYLRVLNLDPDHSPAYSKLANIMIKQGHIKEAISYFKKVIELEPDNKDAFFKYNYLNSLLKGKANNDKVQNRDILSTKNFEIKNNPEGKINLQNQRTFQCHRSGWNFVINSLKPLHNQKGILFDGFIEHNFAWKHQTTEVRSPEVLSKMKVEGTFDDLATSEEKGITPYTEPWIGFIHNPQNIPTWFHYQESPQTIFAKRIWRESLKYCQGLFTFSEYHAKWLREQTEKPVSTLFHPTELPEVTFDFSRFKDNQQKKIIQIGWWLRRLSSIYQLPVAKNNPMNYEKIRLVPLFFANAHTYLKELIEHEQKENNLKINPDYAGNTREIIHVSNEDYDNFLVENIAFVHLYDANANNVVIECIARATPLLINPLPAVMEYLGKDYPMYFTNLDEAAMKALDMNLILETHNYLKNAEIRTKITGKYFLESFKESEVYKLI